MKTEQNGLKNHLENSMETTQPEALRLADIVEQFGGATAYQTAAELRRQHALLNTPELLSFRDGVVLEAAHQRERWSSDHDGGKSPEDWYWLIGHLAGRALAKPGIAGFLSRWEFHTTRRTSATSTLSNARAS